MISRFAPRNYDFTHTLFSNIEMIAWYVIKTWYQMREWLLLHPESILPCVQVKGLQNF